MHGKFDAFIWYLYRGYLGRIVEDGNLLMEVSPVLLDNISSIGGWMISFPFFECEYRTLDVAGYYYDDGPEDAREYED